jgi:hypothetical protein
MYMHTSLPQEQFTAIRSLQVSWDMRWIRTQSPESNRTEQAAPYDWDTWTRFWRLVSTMAGLQSIRCEIEGLDSYSIASPSAIMRPLLAVKQVPDFQLVILQPRDFDTSGRLRRDGILEWCKRENAPFNIVQKNTDAILETRIIMRQIAQKENRVLANAANSPRNVLSV